MDDGSSDDTGHAFQRSVDALATTGLTFRLQRIDHAGKGAAVRSGAALAQGDPIVFLDADLTIPVEIVDDLCRAIDEGADIAIASRYVRGSRVFRPWWRIVMGFVYRAFVRVLVPTGVQDTQCGGKAYTYEAAKALFPRLRIDGFAFDAELLFLARKRGLRVAEVPFVLRQPRGTSIDFLEDAPRMVADLIRIRVNALRGRYR